mmetsp:Transcript_23835/g.34848  ORF Transcript_23835/g.34848 Transcript_23835/m.34848 type:complete len:490 (-) Transcript_23835:83-1552(-)|eukprot:CAMPEP_0195530830 /NCGR_PEP_ID=MMETSP0794_2-20130614/33890_1 /TAXON_ID=515487 /ORGANISM="Stephanopyxis turris, Strain CCMP 815" /LENGTH=489 /DNA_ID=CAMNT_0040662417 /DNA_START=64 /DNA_END=1533 /DNA_ORIENTATION=-
MTSFVSYPSILDIVAVDGSVPPDNEGNFQKLASSMCSEEPQDNRNQEAGPASPSDPLNTSTCNNEDNNNGNQEVEPTVQNVESTIQEVEPANQEEAATSPTINVEPTIQEVEPANQEVAATSPTIYPVETSSSCNVDKSDAAVTKGEDSLLPDNFNENLEHLIVMGYELTVSREALLLNKSLDDAIEHIHKESPMEGPGIIKNDDLNHLLAMGYEKSISQEALLIHSSMTSAIDYIHEQHVGTNSEYPAESVADTTENAIVKATTHRIDDDVEILAEMGFERSQSKKALSICGSQDAAIDYITCQENGDSTSAEVKPSLLSGQPKNDNPSLAETEIMPIREEPKDKKVVFVEDAPKFDDSEDQSCEQSNNNNPSPVKKDIVPILKEPRATKKVAIVDDEPNFNDHEDQSYEESNSNNPSPAKVEISQISEGQNDNNGIRDDIEFSFVDEDPNIDKQSSQEEAQHDQQHENQQSSKERQSQTDQCCCRIS